ncbi:hypothetical protein [Nocardia sp. NPDC050793]
MTPRSIGPRQDPHLGSYDLGVERTPAGWRVNKFHYLLKVVDGNADLS